MQLNAQYQAEKSHKEMPHEEKSKKKFMPKMRDGNTYAPAWWTLNYHAQSNQQKYLYHSRNRKHP